jgi:hypothetical protein
VRLHASPGPRQPSDTVATIVRPNRSLISNPITRFWNCSVYHVRVCVALGADCVPKARIAVTLRIQDGMLMRLASIEPQKPRK